MSDQPLTDKDATLQSRGTAAGVPRAQQIPPPSEALDDAIPEGQREQVLDIDSELQGGAADVPVIVMPEAGLSATPIAPATPVPPPVVSPPPSPAPVPPPPPPPVRPIAVPQRPVPQITLASDPPKPPPGLAERIRVNAPVQPPAPVAPAPNLATPLAVPQSGESLLKQSRSFASLTPLAMPTPVEPVLPPQAAPVPPPPPPPPPQPIAPQIPPSPPTTPAFPPVPVPVTPTVAVPIQKPVEEVRMPPIAQGIPGSAELAPGTITKQQSAVVVEKPTDTPPEPERPQSIVEQLRGQAASILHPLRTYQTDAQVRIKEHNVSLISVAAAEERRRSQTQALTRPALKPILEDAPKHHYLQTVLLVFGTAALLAGGAGVLAYMFIPKTVTLQDQQLAIAHPIEVDESVELQFGGLSHDQLMQLLTDMRDKTGLSLGLIREIYFTLPTDTGGKRLATVGEVMPRMAPHMPAELLRSLDPPFLVGVHVYDANQGFIILKTNAYEQAYSSMLSWEPTMRQDLLPFMDRRPGEKLTSDIAPTTTPAKVLNSAFVDVVLKNHDARALYDNVGNLIFLYSFLDRNTIIIATNDRTLSEAISRVNGRQ